MSMKSVALVAGCLALIVALGANAGAATNTRTTVVLGSTATTPDPSCPESPCQAIGSVTGFQVSTSQGQLPFRVPGDGTVKSWTLTLSQPTGSQRSFFNGFFGTPPEARLAILAPTPLATTCVRRARSRCSAPTSARRSSSAPTCGC
jgi:hypothetical protein